MGGWTSTLLDPYFYFVFCFLITPTHTRIQLKFYAKVNNPEDINIDDNSLAAAVCEDEHKKEYDGACVVVFFICGLLIPISVIILVVAIIWSSHEKISDVINEEQNHANFAAIALTGLLFSTFVVSLDIVALVLFFQGKHEFPTLNNLYSLTLIFTTVWDTVAVLVAYIPLIALCLKPQIVWLVILMCFAPLLCIASHSGYIIVAWLSDTQHGGPATFFYIISFSYYFIAFRQFYKCCNRKRHQEGEEHPPQSRVNGQTAERTNTTNTEERQPETQPLGFNLSSFSKDILLSPFLVAIEVIVICSLILLPATITAAPTVGSLAALPGRTRSGNESNVFHLAFIIITGFFTYKFLYTENEPKQFMKAFVNYLNKKDLEDIDVTGKDVEVAGNAVGKVAYTIIEEYRKKTNRENISTNTDPVETQV